MLIYKGFILCIFIFAQIQKSNAKIVTFSSVQTIFEFGTAVVDLINSANSVTSAEIISEMQTLINTAKIEIINAIHLQSKIEIIDSTIHDFSHSLHQLQDILDSKSGSERQQLEDIFLEHYVSNKIDSQLHSLPDLLTYQSPVGPSKALLTLVNENLRCNISALKTFRNFYLDLVGKGLVLKSVYYKLKSSVDLTSIIDEWEERKVTMVAAFDAKELECYVSSLGTGSSDEDCVSSGYEDATIALSVILSINIVGCVVLSCCIAAKVFIPTV